eukprot:760023-Hanusia_phi.AAC.1
MQIGGRGMLVRFYLVALLGCALCQGGSSSAVCGSCSFYVSEETGLLSRKGSCINDCKGKLDLSFLGIKHIDPGTFDGLSRLQNLSLRHNQLSTLPAGIFSGTTSLEELDLSNNQFACIPADAFEKLSALRRLNIASNNLACSFDSWP